MAKTEANPLEALKLSPWFLEGILPWAILECAKINRDVAARRWHPDITADKKDISRFREAQAAYDAFEAASDAQRAAWLKSYLRPRGDEAMRKELAQQTRKQAEHNRALRLIVAHCLVTQTSYARPTPKSDGRPSETAAVISAWYPKPQPTCRILLANAVLRSNRLLGEFGIELEVMADGSIVCFDVERMAFYKRDGVPENIPYGWLSIHASKNHPSHYFQRQEETGKPFPFQLVGTIYRTDAETYFRTGYSAEKMENPLPADDPFFSWGVGTDWSPASVNDASTLWPLPDMKTFDPRIWASNNRDLVLSRVVEGEIRFWVIGPIQAAQVAGTVTEPDGYAPGFPLT